MEKGTHFQQQRCILDFKTIFNSAASYFKLIRPMNMLISFCTIQLVSYLLLNEKSEFSMVFIWGGLCAVLVGSASNVVNDIYDFEIDKINRPDRILPKQLVSIPNAWNYYFFLICISVISGYFLLPAIPFLIILISNLILFIYSWKLKKTPMIGNIIVSFFIGLVFIYSTLLVDDYQQGIAPFIFAFFMILTREIVKDIEDMEGDRIQMARTIPIVWGIEKAKWISIASLIVCFISLISAFQLMYYGKTFLMIVSAFVILPGLVICYKIYKGTQKKDFSSISMWLKLLILPSLTAIFLDKVI